MDIEAASPGGVEHGGGQNKAIGGDHGRVEIESGERLLCRRIGSQPGGGSHRNPEPLGRDVNRAEANRLAPARRAGLLAIDGGDLVPGLMKRQQRRDGEIRTAHESEAHQAHCGPRLRASAASPWLAAA